MDGYCKLELEQSGKENCVANYFPLLFKICFMSSSSLKEHKTILPIKEDTLNV